MEAVEGLEAVPGGPVGRECGIGYAEEDGALGLEDEVAEGVLYWKMVSENGGMGTGWGSE